MTWLNPAALALLALIPVVLLLHALRYRRRDVRVSTLFLWESVLREAHGSLGLQRLVQNLPLLLQLLLVCVFTAALANPVLTTTVAENKDIVLVLDVSASMHTRTPQSTRFAQAQQRALEVLQALPRGRHMALITAGRQPQVVLFFTPDKDVLREAIMSQQPTDASGNMREAVLLALSFTQGSGTHEVVLIGDGAYGPLFDLDVQHSPIRHIQVAGGEKNIGITRMALRKVLDTSDAYDILIAVKNFSTLPVEVPLQVTAVLRKPLLERRLQLQPGQEEVIVSRLTGPLKGTVQADIAVEDDFPQDNRAYAVVAAPNLLAAETRSSSASFPQAPSSLPSPRPSRTGPRCPRTRNVSSPVRWRRSPASSTTRTITSAASSAPRRRSGSSRTRSSSTSPATTAPAPRAGSSACTTK
jgi:hypothetical protein